MAREIRRAASNQPARCRHRPEDGRRTLMRLAALKDLNGVSPDVGPIGWRLDVRLFWDGDCRWGPDCCAQGFQSGCDPASAIGCNGSNGIPAKAHPTTA